MELILYTIHTGIFFKNKIWLFFIDGSLPDPSRRSQPPPPIKPDPQQSEISRKNIERHGSASSGTHLTEKYDLEESSEFLQPIDDRPPIVVDEDDYQAMEETKTQIHPPNTQSFFTYNRYSTYNSAAAHISFIINLFVFFISKLTQSSMDIEN